jgi:hypothetical protein
VEHVPALKYGPSGSRLAALALPTLNASAATAKIFEMKLRNLSAPTYKRFLIDLVIARHIAATKPKTKIF